MKNKNVKRISLILLAVIFFSIFVSCKHRKTAANALKSGKGQYESENEWVEGKDTVGAIGQDTTEILVDSAEFNARIELNHQTMSYRARIDSLQRSSFFKEDSSSTDMYILLFNCFLFDDKYELYSRGIEYDLTKMLTKYPQKANQLQYYVNLLNHERKTEVLHDVLYSLFYHYVLKCWRNSSDPDDVIEPSIDTFFNRFPLLYSKENYNIVVKIKQQEIGYYY